MTRKGRVIGYYRKDGKVRPITAKTAKISSIPPATYYMARLPKIKPLPKEKLRMHASKEELDFDTIMDNCDYDEESFGKVIREISAKLEPSSGITYGQGEFWFKFNEWKRKTEQ